MNTQPNSVAGPTPSIDPAMVQTFFSMMNIDFDEIFSHGFSVYKIIDSLIKWFFQDGEINLLLVAWLLLVHCVMAVFVSMALTTSMAYKLRKRGIITMAQVEKWVAVKQLTMCDMLVMGFTVNFLMNKQMADQIGIVAIPTAGAPLLIAAEAIHEITFANVHAAVLYSLYGENESMEGESK